MLDSLFNQLLADFGPSQTTRLLSLHTPLGRNVLLAECMVCDESIGPGNALALAQVLNMDEFNLEPLAQQAKAYEQDLTGFRASVTALSTDADLVLQDLLGQPVRLNWRTDGSTGPRERSIHGRVTSFELLGSDGGLSRYGLIIEPGLRFLNRRVDSWVFQSQTVVEIVDEILREHAALLGLQWRWELADEAVYPSRSLCTQFEESDLSFIQRLMAEEGLFYWFEHSGPCAEGEEGNKSDGEAGDELGSHTLVICDTNSLLKAHEGGTIRFTQSSSAVFKEDSLKALEAIDRQVPAALVYGSWDYRGAQLIEASVRAEDFEDGADVAHYDAPGAYAFKNTEQAQRLAQRHLEALQAPGWMMEGVGTWRGAMLCTRWTLSEHPTLEADMELVTLAISHRARNNIQAEQRTALTHRLGALPGLLGGGGAGEGEAESGLPNESDMPLYEGRLLVQPVGRPLRAPLRGGNAETLFDRPMIEGVQTAVVVGTQDPVHTDRDHRVKVQFHWLRGQKASHRLTHGAGSNAPGNQGAGTWVRVATTAANGNGGEVAVPRLGQEVVIGFDRGDPDRPVCLGSVYSGRGRADAQGNEVLQGPSTATGNAGAWFVGTQGGHGHGPVLSGMKTQSLELSQSGSGGYNQLVFDDTPEQSRAMLGSTSQPGGGRHATWLNLGHLRHQTDNQRLAQRGHGLELFSTAQGALRGGSGLLLSTFTQEGGTSARAHSVQALEAAQGLKQSLALTQRLADAAQQHKAGLPPMNPQTGQLTQDPEPAWAEHATAQHQTQALESVEAMRAGGGGGGGGASAEFDGGAGTTSAWARPELVMSAAGGLAITTPGHTLLTAGTTASMVAQQDLNLGAQRNTAMAVACGLSLFTYGKAPSSSPGPSAATGLQLHAASGSISVRANSNKIKAAAQDNIHLTSTTATLQAGAPQHLSLTAQGSALRLEPGKITLTTPVEAKFEASAKIITGPQG